MNKSAVDIIQSNDDRVVKDIFNSDEHAKELVLSLGSFLQGAGLVLTKQSSAVLVEIARTTYYLGYKRGQLVSSIPEFVVPEETD